MDYPLAVAIASAIVFAIGVLLVGEYGFLPEMRGTGRVTTKVFKVAHTETVLQFNPATKTTLPQPVRRPEEFRLYVDFKGENYDIKVSQELYDSVNTQDRVDVLYTQRRISGDIEIQEIQKV